MPKYARRAYGKKGYKKYKKYNRIKKMVTGEGPTMVEKIAAGVGGVATLAKAVMPAIAAINTEHKYADYNFTGNAYGVNTSPVLQCLTNVIAQGTNDNERIGNSILAKDIYFRCQIGWLPSASIQVGISRFILFAWKDNASANAPSANKVLNDPSNINSPINKDYSDQFVVLKDKTIAHNAYTTSVVMQSYSHMKVYKTLNYHMRWTASSATSITQNHVYILFLGAGATAANQSTITCYSRLNFTDN